MSCGPEPDLFDAEEVAGNSVPSDGPEKNRGIEMGRSTTTFPGKWDIDGKSTVFEIDENDESQVEMSGVEGRMFNEGELASRFFSEHGTANTKTGRLVLSGDVRFTSEENAIYLTADEVTYYEDRQLIEAKGSVWLRSDTWNLGPLDRLVSNPSLTKAGTPGIFK